jgi:hypothetical protein
MDVDCAVVRFSRNRAGTDMNQAAIDRGGPERVFQPEPAHGHRNNSLLFLAFALVVLIIIPDAASRLVFIAFAGVFVGLFLFLSRRDARKRVHLLRLSPAGLHHEPLVGTCGVNTIPWPQIRALDIFYGTNGPDIPGPGPRWLRIHLYDGPLRSRLATPIAGRIFGGDINILMDFDADPETILSEATAFHARYR